MPVINALEAWQCRTSKVSRRLFVSSNLDPLDTSEASMHSAVITFNITEIAAQFRRIESFTPRL
jgi:hypothetical protein